MTSFFVDAYQDEYGVEPICEVIEIAPSTYYERSHRRQRPETAPARVKRDAQLKQEIPRVFDENFQVYGARKVWRQLKCEGPRRGPLYRRKIDAAPGLKRHQHGHLSSPRAARASRSRRANRGQRR
jgi:hypothetical protein